jgi:UDP-hydrolysing UDP-N-acetyl-D-glucosamine 2-epimerase
MSKRKVCIVVTARPSYSRIRSALLALKDISEVEVQLVLAGSSLLDMYGNILDYVRQDGLDISAKVFNVVDGLSKLTSAKTTGLGLIELATVFDNLNPDVVVTIADRFETMATAVAAAYMHIPLVHIQGGEVTGSIDEKVRHSITKLADLHLVSTNLARERVIRMGEIPDKVHVTGCPSIDIAKEVMDLPNLDFNFFEKYGGVGDCLELDKGYLVVMQHPVTNESLNGREQMMITLNAVKELALPVLCFWPNIDAGSDQVSKAIRVFRERGDAKSFHFFKNMQGHDFLKLLINSKALIGNSSVGVRECSFMGVPVVNVGTRQGGREYGPNVIHSPHDLTEIKGAVMSQIERGKFESSHLYGNGSAGPKIAELIANAELSSVKKLSY